MRAVVTVIGADKPGIIAAVSAVLYKHNVNILDISQTVLQSEIFTMVMLVDLAGMNTSFPEMKEGLEECAAAIGMEIAVQREEIFNSMHRI